MNLRHRFGLLLLVGLVLCLALLGRELVRPNDAARAPASIADVAAVADALVTNAPPAGTHPASTLTPTDAAAEIVMPLQRGHTLRGRVYDETSGAGIASAVISFREAHIGRFEGDFRNRVRATTTKDGSFVIDGVPAGSIILSVSAPRYAMREIDAFIADKPPPLQIALSTGGAVSGYLVAADGLTPVQGSAHLFHLDENYGYGGRTSDAGEFSFERLPPGRYRITGRSAAQSAEWEFSLGKDERYDGLVLALTAGRTIRGVITGLSRADLERVRVTVRRDDLTGDIEGVGVDAGGAYGIHGVEPGQVTVAASVSMRRQISRTVQVPQDADVTADFEFPRGARLTGNVTRGGKPVSKVWLQPQPMSQEELLILGTRTSERGEYVIEDVPKGEYFMRVGSYRSRNFDVSGDTVFDIDVPFAQLFGRTFEEGGKAPVVGVDVDLWSTQSDSARLQWRERSNHSGEFTFAGVEPGNYVLSAYKPGYEMHRERISYASGMEGMTIRLRQGNGVEVRLREAGSGRPLRNVRATEMIDGRPGTSLSLRLDENGVGYIPSALARSTLTFHTRFHVPAVVADWNGQELDLQLEQNTP